MSERHRFLFLIVIALNFAPLVLADTIPDFHTYPEYYERQFLSVPMIYKKMCIAQAEWTSLFNGRPIAKGAQVHSIEFFPTYSDGTCSQDPIEAYRLSEKYKIEAQRFEIPQASWARDSGVDRHKRNVVLNHNINSAVPAAKHVAVYASVSVKGKKDPIFCAYTHSSSPVAGYDPKRAPEKPITLIEAPYVEYIDEHGRKQLDEDGFPYTKPECPPLLDAIDKELPLEFAHLAPFPQRERNLKPIADLTGLPPATPAAQAAPTEKVRKVSFVKPPPHAQAVPRDGSEEVGHGAIQTE